VVSGDKTRGERTTREAAVASELVLGEGEGESSGGERGATAEWCEVLRLDGERKKGLLAGELLAL
jgi:hypothetical protein